jgi:hypothetical protein
VLLLPLIAVTTLLLRRRPGTTRGQLFRLFVAAGVLVAALALTKATTLPVYAAGLAVAWIYLTVRAGRLNLRALVLGVGVAAAYTVTFFVVLRGAASSVRFDPGGTFESLAARMGGGSAVPVIAVVVVVGWVMPLAGALLIRRRVTRDPMPVFLVAGFAAAVLGASLLVDRGDSQLFFVRTGFVFGVLLATWGLGSLERRQFWVAGVALLIGVAAIYWGRERSPRSCTTSDCFGQSLAVALVIAVLGIGVFGLILRGSRRTWAVIAVAVLVGTTVSPTVASVRRFADAPLTSYDSIAPGGIEAAQFIRRNSGSDDRIATNVHCHQARASHCQRGSYWIAGYAERRVLVEGWAYQARVDDSYPAGVQGPYWDQEQLRLNDEVFSNPSRQVIETLRTKYGVHWLLLDERVSAAPKNLDKLTELRFQLGTVRVYQIFPPPTENPFPTRTPSPTGSPSTTPGSPTSAPTSSPGFPTGSQSTGVPSGPVSPGQTQPTQPFPTGPLPTSVTPTAVPAQLTTTPGPTTSP